jgi:hypothetical protein
MNVTRSCHGEGKPFTFPYCSFVSNYFPCLSWPVGRFIPGPEIQRGEFQQEADPKRTYRRHGADELG